MKFISCIRLGTNNVKSVTKCIDCIKLLTNDVNGLKKFVDCIMLCTNNINIVRNNYVDYLLFLVVRNKNICKNSFNVKHLYNNCTYLFFFNKERYCIIMQVRFNELSEKRTLPN